MKRVTAFAVLLVVLAAPAWAGFDEGLAAYNRGDYATALREWRPLAAQGNAAAQYNLGLMYDKGHGVAQFYAEAAKWYHRAAEQGVVAAQHNLGVMYYQDQGVVQDYAEAVKWFRKAAMQGHASAQYNLGVMYRKGQGVPQDDAEAAIQPAGCVAVHSIASPSRSKMYTVFVFRSGTRSTTHASQRLGLGSGSACGRRLPCRSRWRRRCRSSRGS